MCTLTALPDIYYRETQADEAKAKSAEAVPKPPELKPGQTAKFDPFNRQWRVYTPKQPKYRVVFDTDEIVYLERREHNARLTQSRNELLAIKVGPGHKKERKYHNRAQVDKAEADACARTIQEVRGQSCES